MAKSDRRKKSNKECTVDIAKYNESVRVYVQSSGKVFEHFEWGCKWSDLPMGVLDKMQEDYEQVVLSKKQKEKEYVSSNLEGVWQTTTHSNYYEPYSAT